MRERPLAQAVSERAGCSHLGSAMAVIGSHICLDKNRVLSYNLVTRFRLVRNGADPWLWIRRPGSPYPYENLRVGEVEPSSHSSSYPLHALSVVKGRFRGRSDEHEIQGNGSLRPWAQEGARGAILFVPRASFVLPPWCLWEGTRARESASPLVGCCGHSVAQKGGSLSALLPDHLTLSPCKLF